MKDIPSWWKGHSSYFLSQGWCWIDADRVDKAIANLTWYAQIASRERDFSRDDLERSQGLYTTFNQKCAIESNECDLLVEQVKPLLIDMFALASQSA